MRVFFCGSTPLVERAARTLARRLEAYEKPDIDPAMAKDLADYVAAHGD